MTNKLFLEILANTPEELSRFVEISMIIPAQINCYLKQKNLTLKDLADKLGKKESEISKWMYGNHNFSIKTIAKIEAALGEDILIVPKYSDRKTRFPDESKPVTGKSLKENIPASKVIYKTKKQKSLVADKKKKYGKKK
ncbi:MAG: XRE family transcriptional regulator [Ignavibacteriae bacterium]|nr:MAG: XRE family transcriptional regulator [Ignavibacteriota bacterium]